MIVMNYKKLLFYTISVIWEVLVLVQQIYWIINENYSFIAFILGVLELLTPYFIYKVIKED